MKQLQFGTQAALDARTPKYIKAIYQIIGLLSAIWVLVSPNFPEIPEHTQTVILKILISSNTVIYAICQQFGYVKEDPEQTTNNENV